MEQGRQTMKKAVKMESTSVTHLEEQVSALTSYMGIALLVKLRHILSPLERASLSRRSSIDRNKGLLEKP
jgi:hypothetical protein